jgi:hypothetical protein
MTRRICQCFLAVVLVGGLVGCGDWGIDVGQEVDGTYRVQEGSFRWEWDPTEHVTEIRVYTAATNAWLRAEPTVIELMKQPPLFSTSDRASIKALVRAMEEDDEGDMYGSGRLYAIPDQTTYTMIMTLDNNKWMRFAILMNDPATDPYAVVFPFRRSRSIYRSTPLAKWIQTNLVPVGASVPVAPSP